ncbi:MAG: cryptochrome/photolyase family protein [Wenzhouxiangella sp.]
MNDLAIVWFRRDLRLADNPALDHARKAHAQVLPVFIHDPAAEGDWAPGGAQRWWLHHSLAELDQRLRERGGRLHLLAGDSADQMDALLESTGACAVYWNRVYEPALVERDKALKARLRDWGLTVQSFRASLLFEPWELRKDNGEPYQVFTPYWKQMQRRWRAPETVPEPRELNTPEPSAGLELAELALQPRHDWARGFRQRFEPGELAARRRLRDFVDQAVEAYHGERDRPDHAGTSRFSPHLHHGELSPGQVVLALDESGQLPTGEGRLSLVRELAWREFSAVMLFDRPSLPEQPLKSQFDAFPWRQPSDYAQDLQAWQRGQTGIPMVDAGMRELWATGWMHNRVRMIVASFLTKNLLIPWQEGARWFWDTLVDADLASNTQGWQWTAGCGADAAPYFRVFNPVLQGQKFDPRGDYVRRWCPELARRPQKRLHEPLAEGERWGDYPAAIVDLKASRQRALDAYDQVKGQSG